MVLRFIAPVLLSCLFIIRVSGQTTNGETGFLKEGTLVIRVKENFRHICSDNRIDHPLMLAVLAETGNGQVSKMFPFHRKPEKETDDYGNSLVDLSLIYVVEFSPEYELLSAARLMMSSGIIEYAEPYVIPETLYVPDDPFLTNQYYLSNIKAYDAWEIWRGDTNFVVGITDTGYEFNHPDLVSAVKYNYNDTIDGIDNDNDGYIDNFMGWNLGENNNNPQYNAIGHGIHVSGIAGATPDNSFGIAGVGFNTRLLPVKIDNAAGLLTMSWQGIVYAADHGAQVINCSWGSTFSSGQFGQDIINYATFNRNALVVAACGNSNNERMHYPCAYQNVLCVAATKDDDLKWENSSYYRRVDLSAPGFNIYSTWVNGSFVYSGGTSMASPLVAGTAALVWSYMPQLTPLQLSEHLKNTADIIDTLPQNILFQQKLGYGRLNMYRALTDTMKPAVKLQSVDITDNNNQVFGVNDTLFITGNFFNFLAQTNDLRITMQCVSPFVQMIDSLYIAGVQSTMTSFNNAQQPFSMKLLPGIPSSYNIELKFEYADSGYTGFDFYSLTVNIDYLDLNINKITATITSKGTIGYNDNINFQQGRGLRFENSSSLLSCAGFMIGRSNNQVSDNLYGFATPFDADFEPIMGVGYVVPPQKGDQQITGVFNDDGAGTQKLNIEMLHNNFAWDLQGRENFVIVEAIARSNHTDELTNMYFGMFVDWELGIYSQNKANTNQLHRFGYVFNTDSSLYAAIQLLTPGNFSHYAIDNDGRDGSVNLQDGFSSTEKFMSLSNTRSTAGNEPFGNDVSGIISTGPYLMLPGDTVRFAWALHVANTYIELLESVENAQLAWNELISADVARYQQPGFSLFPVPFCDEVTVFSDHIIPNSIIELFDITGRIVYSSAAGQNQSHVIDAPYLQPGTYIVRITGKETITGKIIKL